MARFAFDIETNGLLDTMDTIHSLVIQDADTGKVHCLSGKYIEDGIWMLHDADQIIGHNLIGFDIPAIQLIYPEFQPNVEQVYDTLVMSRVIWANLMDRDAKDIAVGKLEKRLIGSHGLEAWGQPLGAWKGDY